MERSECNSNGLKLKDTLMSNSKKASLGEVCVLERRSKFKWTRNRNEKMISVSNERIQHLHSVDDVVDYDDDYDEKSSITTSRQVVEVLLAGIVTITPTATARFRCRRRRRGRRCFCWCLLDKSPFQLLHIGWKKRRNHQRLPQMTLKHAHTQVHREQSNAKRERTREKGGRKSTLIKKEYYAHEWKNLARMLNFMNDNKMNFH